MRESPINAADPGKGGSDFAATILKIDAGDSAALLSLYDETCAQVFGVILRIVDDRLSAEETLLDFYTQVWRHAGAVGSLGAAGLSWLVRLARAQVAGQDAMKTPGGELAEDRPPDYLRDLLVVRVEREGQIPAARPAPLPTREEPDVIRRTGPTPSFKPAPPKRRAVLPWILALLFAGVAALAGYQWRQTERFLDHSISRQRELETGAQHEQESLRSQLEQYRARIQELDQINAILGNRGSRMIGLAPQASNPDMWLAAFLNESNSRCVITGTLKPAPEGSDYQVWIVGPSAKVSAGLLAPDSNGHAFAVLDIDPGIQKVLAIMVTVEPRGGSQQPTTPAVGLGRFG